MDSLNSLNSLSSGSVDAKLGSSGFCTSKWAWLLAIPLCCLPLLPLLLKGKKPDKKKKKKAVAPPKPEEKRELLPNRTVYETAVPVSTSYAQILEVAPTTTSYSQQVVQEYVQQAPQVEYVQQAQYVQQAPMQYAAPYAAPMMGTTAYAASMAYAGGVQMESVAMSGNYGGVV